MSNEELQIIISAEIADLEKKLTKAQKDTESFGDKGKKAFEAFSKAAGAVGKAVGTAMKATATAVAAGATALAGLAESTRESRTETAKLNAAFEAVGSSAEVAGQTYNDLYRFLGDSGTATEAAQQLANITTEQDKLAEYTNICQGVYAKWGTAIDSAGFAEGINHTIALGEVQGTLADALEFSGVSVDSFNEKLAKCNTESEREALIRSTLTDMYGESASAYEENASSILAANEAQAKLQKGLDALGAAAEPVVNIFKSGLADALNELTPHFEKISSGLMGMVEGLPSAQYTFEAGIKGLMESALGIVTDLLPKVLEVGVKIITALIEGIVEVFPSVVQTIADLIPSIIEMLVTLIPQVTGAILNALPLILETLIQMIVSIIEGLAAMLPTIVTQIMTVLPILIEQLLLSIPLLLEAAVTLLLAIVEAIPLIIVPLLEALPQIINTLLDVVLESIPLLIEAAIELLMAIVEAIPEIIPPLVEALPEIIDGIITTLLDNLPLILEAAIELLYAVIDAIPQILPPLVNALPDIIRSITETLMDNLPAIIDCAFTLFMGIVEAIPDIVPELLKAIGNLLWEALKAIGGAFVDIGASIGVALGGGIKTAIQGVLSAAIGVINGFLSAINIAIGVINLIPNVNIKKLKMLEVPKLAEGGVVDSATLAMVGEAGKEAVVPLENNLEWLDKLAGMLNERLNGGLGNSPVVLKVGERVLGEVCIDAFNGIYAQTGDIPIVIG